MRGPLISRRTAPVLAGVAVVVTAGVVYLTGDRAPATAPPASEKGAPGERPAAEAPSILAEPDHQGDLTLEGRVIDRNDAPAAGALVTLSSQPAREVKTAADGGFRFDRLPPGSYTLVARTADASAGPLEVTLGPETTPVVLRLRRSAALVVSVIDGGTRRAIAAAAVELRGVALYTAVTGGDGRATIAGVAPDRYVVVAGAAGYGKSHASVRVPVQTETVEVQLALTAGAPVSGRVVTEQGQPVAEAQVFYEPASASNADVFDPARDGTVTDAGGRFQFASLSRGSYRFAAQHRDHAPGRSAPVTIDGRHPVEVEIVVSPGAVLAGTVVERSGAPVESAVIRIGPRTDGQARLRQVTSDARGQFRLTGLPRAVMELAATGRSAASALVAVDLAATPHVEDLRIVLEVDGAIAGTVAEPGGAPVAGAKVFALFDLSTMSAVHRLRPLARAVSGADGAFRLVGLSPGEYNLVARRPDARPLSDLTSEPGTRARTGDADVLIYLARGGAIKGRVAYANGTAPPLFTVGIGMGAPAPFTGGAFTVEDVPPGRVALTISGPSFDTKVVPDVAVASDRVTDVGNIVVRQGRSISGRVLTADGRPAPEVKVMAGYRLIGDGQQLTMQAWGPSGGGGEPKETTSDAEGRYAFRGVGFREVAVIADHPELGRSRGFQVPASDQSSVIDLVLSPLAAVEGRVTRGGAPVANTAVNASPRAMSLNSNFVVQTGEDGRFRFDRLAADDYVISAMTGVSPLVGISMRGVAVTVKGGGTAAAPVEIALPAPPATVAVTVVHGDGSPVKVAEVVSIDAALTVATARDIHQRIQTQTAGFNSFNIIVTGRPARINNVGPGPLTVCAIPFPRETEKMATASVMAYVEAHLDSMKAFCKSMNVAGGGEVPVQIEVESPPLAAEIDRGSEQP